MKRKVFISHASEDKDRFVLGFAEKLRAKGIDAWVDRWEMYPGDSLVDKIFEEGIKNANAIIVIVSNNSINKPWVRKELNAAFIKKINEGSRLIPVIIDDCQVPECLKDSIWQKIPHLNDYEKEFERIVMSIYGHRDKPPLGSPPEYAQLDIDTLPNLTKADTIILTEAVGMVLQQGHPHVDAAELFGKLVNIEISDHQFGDSMEILVSRGFVKAPKVFGGVSGYVSIEITPFGFDAVARAALSDYDTIVRNVVVAVVNGVSRRDTDLASELDLPTMMVSFIFDLLESRGLARTAKVLVQDHEYAVSEIVDISPELKRMVQ